MKFTAESLITALQAKASETSGIAPDKWTIGSTLYPGMFPGVDLDGWTLYEMVEDYPRGQRIYVAAHMETGETKTFEDLDSKD